MKIRKIYKSNTDYKFKMDPLTIIVSGDDCDFQITIKDPQLLEIYGDNPDGLRDYFQSAVYDVLGELYLPRDLRRRINALNIKHHERKIRIIERLKPQTL